MAAVKNIYAIGQLGLLGLPSVLFIPLLLRWVDVNIVATLLVAQAYVYYLVLLQQFGFNLIGPARLNVANDDADRGLLSSAFHFKSALFLINALAWIAMVFILFDGAPALLFFLMLFVSYVFNSNWYLQSRHDFYTGFLSAGLGVAVSLAMLAIVWLSKHNEFELIGLLGWMVIAMIAPQMMVGIFSGVRAIRMAGGASGFCSWPAKNIFRQGAPLIISQLLLLASTTLGTIVVGYCEDSNVTAAYAATEKIFNLAATALVSLYAVYYPQLALAYRSSITEYWCQMWRFNGRIAALAFVGLILIMSAGEELLEIYMGKSLAGLVSLVLVPMAIWLTLVPFQNALQCHLAIMGKTTHTIGIACAILAIEILVGGSMMAIKPLYWVYGMVVAEFLPLLLLIHLYRTDMRVESVK